MQKIVATFIFLLFISTSFAQTDKLLKGVEKELNELLGASQTAGFAVAVVKGDQIIYASGFGYSDFANKIPVDANTIFPIASCSKAFTAAILGQLKEADKLSFGDSPIKYIPELKFFNTEMNNQVTIRDMMTHSTGLPRHDGSWYLFPMYNQDTLIKRIAFMEPVAHVRESWSYNNIMYITQGVIAERITGKSWEDNIKEQFFLPMGMTRSSTSLEEMKKSSNVAVGHTVNNDSIQKVNYFDMTGLSAAGGINSSVTDMSKWVITWINGGKYQGKQILPANYVTEAISSQVVVGASLPEEEHPDIHLTNYGYGWFIASYKGHYRVAHNGSIDGFTSNTSFFPSDSVGIIILTNQEGSNINYFIRGIISDRILGTSKSDWVQEYKDQQDERRAMEKAHALAEEPAAESAIQQKPPHTLNDYTGTYYYPGYGAFTVTLKSDSLFAHFKGREYYLKHFKYDIFDTWELTDWGMYSPDINFRFNFRTDLTGVITAIDLKIEEELQAIEFLKE